MTDSLPELIERKRQLVAEITAKQNEVATIDSAVEAKALCLARDVGESEQPDFSVFRDETERLLLAFWNAPDNILFKDDIRRNVILDKEASDGAIRHVINRARKALKDTNFPYNIRNIVGKGYRFVDIGMLPSVPKIPKTGKNKKKCRGKR